MSKLNVTDLTIIIPSLNPDEKLIHTLDGIMKKGFSKIVLIDDGSDAEHKTPFKYAEEKGCTVLVHPTNKGKGRALKTAFKHCLKDDSCLGVITVDGDGQHGPEDIYRCGEEMLAKKNKCVILGCRDFKEPQVPFKSKHGNNITKFAFRALCGIKISDTQTGLRAIPKDFLLNMLYYKGERFEYETNMLLEMKNQGIPFSEVKIETIYLDENASSHFHPFRDSWKIYKLIFKYSFSLLKFGISSGLSAILDVILFYFILYSLRTLGVEEATQPVFVATILARFFSSIFNFLMNQKVVFQSTSESSSLKYYALCILQMTLSASLVNGVCTILSAGNGGAVLIKLVIDTILFFLSYHIQKNWVFKQ